MKTIPITSKIKKVVIDVIRIAILYEKLTGRKLGITGEVGEILVCSHKKFKPLGLKLLSDPISAGYDAVDKRGNCYQIKARRGGKTNAARLSRFSNHKFHFAVLAIFDKNYKIKELWQVSYKKLLPIIQKCTHRNPSLGQFKRAAKQIL